MRVVFWENIVSQHKLPYWQHLAASTFISEFTLVVQQPLTHALEAQGWCINENDLKNINLVIEPTAPTIETLIKSNQSTSYHVFSGIRAFPMVYQAFKISLNYKVHRILLTESINFYGLRSITRRLAAFWIERMYLKDYDLVLGSGSSTKKWYLECGLRETSFYPFMYAIESLNNKEKKLETSSKKLLFIGQLIQRKGLDILIGALSNLKHYQWSLDIYGAGEEKTVLKNMVKSMKLEDRIVFKGVINNNELKSNISAYHFLVLPSRFDGWGAVVNEAIAAGLKVICSNRCGASILLVDKKIGHVFNIQKPQELAKLLEKAVSEKDDIDYDYIHKYSCYLTGEKVAQYFISILQYHYKQQGQRPLPPWEQFLHETDKS